MADSFTGTHEQAERIEEFVRKRGGTLKPTALDRALLAGAAALRAEQGWRTIDSAPKDRRRVLLYVPTEVGGDYTRQIGQYDDDYSSDPPEPFWRYDGDATGRYSRAHQPTHWMPLPSPPSRAEQGRQNEKDQGGTRLTEGAAVSVLVRADQLTHAEPK